MIQPFRNCCCRRVFIVGVWWSKYVTEWRWNDPLTINFWPGTRSLILIIHLYFVFFKYFFYYCDYQNISDETNTCAEQFLQNKQLYEKPSFKRWKDTTALEMKRFFAVVIAMGIITLLDISGPWHQSCVMSRDRCPGIEAYFLLQSSFERQWEIYPTWN